VKPLAGVKIRPSRPCSDFVNRTLIVTVDERLCRLRGNGRTRVDDVRMVHASP